ncbi:23S rRNA pseudouridine(955/2504/2580) synthase RluC [Bermanella marisrubri]|uniref:Pseudouridine synthase n=1 Tax=Bermanella marisrubri TaxID=207949 RepID=Q1N4V6_9GAMM|nr:23S rRNA pseudouridine(955/2504/2580) synthase RluC [Bermanella marisrubri]EAT13322.1 ribosomal large subunit pseudouridine synthase C (pseudouridylate synthase) (uracil hydrolyase) [Oceanobacter sp. RED65] [Bermanella marisrubri]QIZ84082.1 23S rRNA pseudouridine(955/2504/2580) synthase RluC [Bermanella marisrubri]
MSENSKRGVQFEEVTADYVGQRIDNFLMSRIKGAPKSLVYRIIRKGEVRVNKGRIKPEYKVKLGDVVRIPPVKVKAEGDAAPISKDMAEGIEQSILFEDDYFLAVNKPRGMAVHGGSGISLGLIEVLRNLRPKAKRLELVHRLDRDTSGVILVAKRRTALVAFHKMLQRKQGMQKRYLALVYGNWPKHLKDVEVPLKKNELKSGERLVKVAQDGKPSHTRYSIERKFKGYTLVNAEPVTGRTHQIRVHCQFSGHNIVGDEKYATDEELQGARQQGARRLFLHAQSLRFKHPETGEKMTIQAPLDEAFEQFLSSLDAKH